MDQEPVDKQLTVCLLDPVRYAPKEVSFALGFGCCAGQQFGLFHWLWPFRFPPHRRTFCCLQEDGGSALSAQGNFILSCWWAHFCPEKLPPLSRLDIYFNLIHVYLPNRCEVVRDAPCGALRGGHAPRTNLCGLLTLLYKLKHQQF